MRDPAATAQTPKTTRTDRFDITDADIGRYVRRKSTGAIGRVRRDEGNGWLHPMPIAPEMPYEWKCYRSDLEYVDVGATASRVMPDLPAGWSIAKIEVRRDQAWCFNRPDLTYDALLERAGGDYEARGSGPTPYAAVGAALQEIHHAE